MMQLGISFINKEWNEGFVIDAMRSINKEVFKVKDEKSKATAKLNKFDVDSVLLKENNETYKQ